MASMVGMDDTTLGGRLRIARTSIGEKIRNFAPKVGISANYLGLAERGERIPSSVVVQKIATATGKDFNWLMTGDGPDVPEKSAPLLPKLPETAVNPKMFLNLVLLHGRDITKKNLAFALRVSDDELDRILSGDDTVFRDNWAVSFAMLAECLDLSAMLRDLEALTAYLRGVAENAKCTTLRHSVQSYLRESHNWDSHLGGLVKRTIEYDGSAAPCISMLLKVAEPNERDVRVLYFTGATLEPVFLQKMAEQELQALPFLDNAYLVIVFEKASSYRHFVSCAKTRWTEMRTPSSDDPYSMSGFSLPLVALLVDKDTMEIKEKQNVWIDE